MAGKPDRDGEATDISPVSAAVAPRSIHTFVVRVVAGPDDGKAFTVDPSQAGRILLGSSPACAVRLEDPSVSRRHAALEVEAGALRLFDLGSTNGTLVNGIRAF